MLGLAPKTLKVFQDVSTLACIEGYVLVGGTALSLQINHRLSEDLDFCKWVDASSAKNGIAFQSFARELKEKFKKVDLNPIDFDQADFILNGEVKVQFFNEVGYNVPTHEVIPVENNLVMAPIALVGAMKIKTMFQRSVFRDYYDVYCILKEGHLTISDLIGLSCQYDAKLNQEMILKRLRYHSSFSAEKTFGTLSPKYAVSSEDIGEFMKNITESWGRSKFF